jgi:ClpP class serine protease
MGNFTDIEKEFNSRIEPIINKILSNHTVITQQLQNNVTQTIQDELAKMRFEKMQTVCNITNRNLICYVSAWLQSTSANPELSINDNDMNGFMNAVSGLDKRKGLDLFLHTPGGVVTATESIVTYLRRIFHGDIRVIVPHMAMSAGTMIACASREIIMGKQSSLGPIDPQYRGVPAQGVEKEFNQALQETVTSPHKSLIWKEIISQYRPTFLGECKNVVQLSNILATDWLVSGMFKNSKKKEEKAQKIIDELLNHDVSKVHDRHYDFVKCKKLGLKVSSLESNQDLQDKILSLYHTYFLSIYRIGSALKFIENPNGQTIMITGTR